MSTTIYLDKDGMIDKEGMEIIGEVLANDHIPLVFYKSFGD